jgi:hypothetical protein
MRRGIAIVVLLLTACASAPLASTATVADRLFCGMAIPGGGAVTQADLDRFVDEVVEPRFPDGFTIWRARGAWRGGSEDVTILEIVHPDDPARDAAVGEIASEYRRRFRQETVLRVRTQVHMDFITE